MSTLDPFIRVVTDMMRRFGGNHTLVKSVDGPYNYDTDSSPSLITEYPIRMIAFDYVQKKDGLGTAFNKSIQEGDKQFYIKPDDSVPFPTPEKDHIIYKGVKHNVVAVKEINPTGSKVIFIEVYGRQ